MSPGERAEIRRALDGAVLNVALLAASLHVDRRLVLQLDPAKRFAIKYAGTRHPMITTPSAAVAARFLDQLGIGSDSRNPGEQITTDVGSKRRALSSFCSTESANKSVVNLRKADQNQTRTQSVSPLQAHYRNHLNFPG